MQCDESASIFSLNSNRMKKFQGEKKLSLKIRLNYLSVDLRAIKICSILVMYNIVSQT